MIYLDTGVLISALYVRDDKHADCVALLDSGEAVTSTHALAETFSTLTGQYGVKNDTAAEAVLSITQSEVQVEELIVLDYRTVLQSARAAGIMGGAVYDALHAQVARRLKAERLYTFNLSNFRHVGRGLDVRAP